MSVIRSPSSGPRSGESSACSSASNRAYTLPVDTSTRCRAARSRTARRAWPGCRVTSTTASHVSPATAASPSSRSRSAMTKATPGGGSALPRARHVTSWPRRSASSATVRPSHAVPPSTNILIAQPTAATPGDVHRVRARPTGRPAGQRHDGHVLQAAVRRPQRAGAQRRPGDEVGQRRVVRHGERHVRPAAPGGRPAVGLDRQVAVGEQPDVERHEGELLAATGVRPAPVLRDRHVDRERTDVDPVARTLDTVGSHAAMVPQSRPGRQPGTRPAYQGRAAVPPQPRATTHPEKVIEMATTPRARRDDNQERHHPKVGEVVDQEVLREFTDPAATSWRGVSRTRGDRDASSPSRAGDLKTGDLDVREESATEGAVHAADPLPPVPQRPSRSWARASTRPPTSPARRVTHVEQQARRERRRRPRPAARRGPLTPRRTTRSASVRGRLRHRHRSSAPAWPT